MRVILLATLIVLHGADQHEIMVNPEQVTSMRAARPGNHPDKLFAEGVACMISLTDGKYVAVVESCQAARRLIEQRRTD
ncbi:hypothetical protein [Bradyrhizobium sp. USDA 10063]